ncbi:malonic semialdehyde reductase [Hydrogenophaga pseudoflava]|uniref:malonic semialdehyde reductase n=1 Tax=Hydrogenophaga pseudoflava TaxID=47421 RepID=UPI0027E3DECE|nr:malonic semialdehyde reductase [Hydrogenophaga pseudoflava]MDQ7745061.1 malonic semialdehyde reductase [Hydrogenophaga pseudoflava]
MSNPPLSPTERAFSAARTFPKFRDEPVSDDTLKTLCELAQWGPTASNCQPARYVFVRSAEGKEKLRPCLAPGNVDKTMSAPVTVIVAQDSRFYEHLVTQFPHMPTAAAPYESQPALAQTVALRNSSLQGAYLIVAARLLGLDCGPMSGFDAEALDRSFFPDGRFRSNFLINLGHGDTASLRPRGPRLPFETVATLA